MKSVFDLVVIGAGASGVISAVQMQARAKGIDIALIDGDGGRGRGLAYATECAEHLLNVPAHNMSAFPDQPGHFASWLSARAPGLDGTKFASRTVYGEYLRSLLQHAQESNPGLHLVTGPAIKIARNQDQWWIELDDGLVLQTARVVLALGHLSPLNPLGAENLLNDQYRLDPWAADVLEGLDPQAAVMMIGTGLTMFDLVLALRHRGHCGPMHAISRHGALPQAHRPVSPRPMANAPILPTAMAGVHWLRAEISSAATSGQDWRAVIDGLRPHSANIWGGWSQASRSSFLRHVRFLWDAHRHRAAPAVAAEVTQLIACGNLRIHAGRVGAVHRNAAGLHVEWQDRSHHQPQSLKVARLINCTGPSSDFARTTQPLVQSLRTQGWLHADPLRLGIETDICGQVLDRHQRPVPGLFTLGPLVRPHRWESTAIPEIRMQAAALAEHVFGSA